MILRRTIAALGLLAMVAAMPMASAVTINIDYGREENTTAGNWNNVSGPSGSTTLNTPSVALIDDTGAATGVTLNTSFDNGGSFAGAGANYDGPYPAAVAGLPQTALQDSGFISGANFTTFTFTGLSVSDTYDFLFYGARGNNGGQALLDVTGGNGTSNLSIAEVLDNSTLVATVDGVTPDGNNEITVVYSATQSASGGARGGLNVIQVTSNPIPEPSSILLVAFGSVGLAMLRRR